MGISGHMLGPRKLRRLNRLTGLNLDRAYIRNRYAEGRAVVNGECVHYAIDPATGESEAIEADDTPVRTCWSSCDERLPGYTPPVASPVIASPSQPRRLIGPRWR